MEAQDGDFNFSDDDVDLDGQDITVKEEHVKQQKAKKPKTAASKTGISKKVKNYSLEIPFPGERKRKLEVYYTCFWETLV